MVYGICYCPVQRHEDLKKAGVADSKTLKEADREKIFEIIHDKNDFIGWSLEIISPVYISTTMNKRWLNVTLVYIIFFHILRNTALSTSIGWQCWNIC